MCRLFLQICAYLLLQFFCVMMLHADRLECFLAKTSSCRFVEISSVVGDAVDCSVAHETPINCVECSHSVVVLYSNITLDSATVDESRCLFA